MEPVISSAPVRTGRFREVLVDGSVFDGQFQDNQRHGDGELRYANGDVYSGQFKKGLRHNKGDLRMASGGEYSGHWRRDKWDGEGYLRFADGREYHGQFVDGRMTGKGRLKFRRSTFPCEAQLQAGELWGENVEPPAAGVSSGDLASLMERLSENYGEYEGQFLDDLFHERGVLRFEGSPHSFDGQWREGRKSGEGKLQIAGHLIYQGHFEEDTVQGVGTLTRFFARGLKDVYTGSFLRGRMHGGGKHTSVNGAFYEGQFADGVRHGEGSLSLRGATYVGQFQHGSRHGRGEYISEVEKYIGNYCDGARHQRGRIEDRRTGA
eukprot:CAMPEP_0204351562 /NCGR_PEP_ID=MMETSP0469-20131031/31221_1 /ASSEMBLY_ACC=CAM_ASM_000384 /TAXON_ID=2969 /ORGANISM="Oxyrrhis marina" /LENGTH=321 /DNA_ID=CAMNT_0051338143 /DNA_START=12 /DNA_END=974 /DNA_ORIENTATION=+